MKKAISIFFAALLILSLAACGGGSGDGGGGGSGGSSGSGGGGGGAPPTKIGEVQTWYEEYIKGTDYTYDYGSYAKEREELGDNYRLVLWANLPYNFAELSEMDASQFEDDILKAKADCVSIGNDLRAHFGSDAMVVQISVRSDEQGDSKNFDKEVCCVAEVDWAVIPTWRGPPIWGYR